MGYVQGLKGNANNHKIDYVAPLSDILSPERFFFITPTVEKLQHF